MFFTALRTFLESQGWLANFIEIATATANTYTDSTVAKKGFGTVYYQVKAFKEIYNSDYVLNNATVGFPAPNFTSIISENLSHDSKVWTKEYDLDDNELKEKEWGEKDDDGNYKYDNLPGFEYVDVTYDTFKWIRKTPKGAMIKEKCGYKTPQIFINKCRKMNLTEAPNLFNQD